MNNDKEIIYLACPYSDNDEVLRYARFLMANEVAAKLMSEGKYIFSPISHTHPIAENIIGNKLPLGWDYWASYDEKIISFCNRIYVLKLKKYSKSIGVNSEIRIAKSHKIPINYIRYDELMYPWTEKQMYNIAKRRIDLLGGF